MAEKAKEATKENIEKTMQTLGYNEFQVPGGADISDESETKAEPEVPKEPEGDASLEETQAEEVVQEEPEQPTLDGVSGVSEDEIKRRDFQRKADMAEMRAKQLEEQNKMLMQLLSGATSQPQPKVQPTKKEPTLYDYIAKEDYDSSEAFDPSTPSGQAYSNWQRAIARYESENSFEQLSRKQMEQQQQQSVLQHAKMIAKEFPEFRSPFSDEPDLQKINMYLGDLAKPENWINLIKSMKSVAEKPQKVHTDMIDKVGKRADKPASAATAASSSEGKKKLPESIQTLQKMFGTFDVPANFSE